MENSKETLGKDIFNILTECVLHKKDKVFSNELTHFVRSDKNRYFFLSEDYYEHYLTRLGDGSFTVEVISEKENVLSRTEKANKMLAELSASK